LYLIRNWPRLSGRKAGAFLVLIALLGGCSGNAEPQVEEWLGDAYKAHRVSSYHIKGKRRDATTRAVATFVLESGERLQLELVVSYNPTPVLDSGLWRLDGPRSATGQVRDESLKFTGGQGEGPSLGGRFRLEENGLPRFRVVLPVRPVDQPKFIRKENR